MGSVCSRSERATDLRATLLPPPTDVRTDGVPEVHCNGCGVRIPLYSCMPPPPPPNDRSVQCCRNGKWCHYCSPECAQANCAASNLKLSDANAKSLDANTTSTPTAPPVASVASVALVASVIPAPPVAPVASVASVGATAKSSPPGGVFAPCLESARPYPPTHLTYAVAAPPTYSPPVFAGDELGFNSSAAQ